MKILLTPKARVRGMTYATVIVSMIVIGTVLAAYLKMVAVQNQLTGRSQTWNRSVPILEAGIEEAMAHLNKNGSPEEGVVDLNRMGLDGWFNNGSLTGPWHKFGWMNGDFYFVSIGAWDGTTNYFPSINSTGWVRQLPAFALRGSRGPFLAQSEWGSFTRRVVSTGTTNDPIFTRPIVAKYGIDMNGQNVTVDSYDSSNPTMSTSNRWDITKRRANGDVASNDTITNTINVGNANIWGRIATGPLGTVRIGSGGKVGDAAWQLSSSTGIQPGMSTDDMNVEFPDVWPPTGSAGWLPPAGGPNYLLTSGDYCIPAGTVSGQIRIAEGATVRLRIDGGLKLTGGDGLTISNGANLKLYLNCPSASIGGNGIINGTGIPINCQIYGSPNLKTLDIGGNGETSCVVYAPNADVTMNGGGSGDNDFSGAIVAKSFRFNGHYNIHYDESLGRSYLWRGFKITSWNEK
jgi:hypothetical protein